MAPETVTSASETVASVTSTPETVTSALETVTCAMETVTSTPETVAFACTSLSHARALPVRARLPRAPKLHRPAVRQGGVQARLVTAAAGPSGVRGGSQGPDVACAMDGATARYRQQDRRA